LIRQPKRTDFSYLQEFKKIKEGEYFDMVCEGFGTHGVTKINNQAYLKTDLKGGIEKYDSFIVSVF
jgi:hypothetical protein